jgi:hypothetical protein
MVFYFTSNVVSPPAYIYVGKDKFESGLALTIPRLSSYETDTMAQMRS